MVLNRPPMGWNSWNTFGKEINETVILESAEALVSSGLADAGYRYVVIDDCWALRERDLHGNLVPDPKKFPHGMKSLGERIHAMGLKFGMYSCCGLMTCAGYPSSLDREWQDAQTFAEWGVDYLKYDYCFRPQNRKGEELYRAMGLALANCGREIVFAACSWGADETEKWIGTSGADTWRSTADVFDNWQSVKRAALKQFSLLPYRKKGCFNDMDMLVVGMNGNGNVGLGGCTFTEYTTHFSAWCLFQSPLFIGCDVRNISDEILSLLKNKALIGVDQDEKCTQVYCMPACMAWEEDGDQLFAVVRLLADGDLAVGLFNFTEQERNAVCLLNDLGLGVRSCKRVQLTDCLTGAKSFSRNGVIEAVLPPHGSVVYRAKIISEQGILP